MTGALVLVAVAFLVVVLSLVFDCPHRLWHWRFREACARCQRKQAQALDRASRRGIEAYNEELKRRRTR